VNLIIDIGNSVAKLAIFDKGELVEVFRGSNHSLDCLPMLCSRYPLKRGIIASVITLSNTIRRQLGRLPFNIIELSHETPVPITNLYKTPQTLGMDRLAAVVAANWLKPGHDVLVIDAGTCVTYDFIDADGSYHGGNISPGMRMRFKALNIFTDKLPKVSAKGEVPMYGQSTETAIRAGVIRGMEFEMSGYITHLQKNYPGLLVFLTGGDEFSFDTKLKSIIFADRFLVLKGLNRILSYNRLISASILLTVTGLAVAQTSTNSPYTRYGFGQLADQNFGNSKAMGGIAYGLRNGYQINASNPASYTAIDSLTFLFDAGMTLQNANFKDGNVKTNAKNSSFDYLAMQFRLWKKMGMTVGFLPFSTVGYSISKTHDFEDVNNNGKWSESYDGDGGFHQVFIGLGYKVFNNLSVGANFSYLYGDITHQSMTTIGATDTRSIKLDKFSISDYKLDFGLQYTYKLNKKNTINIGAVYTLGRTLHGDAYKYHQTGAESNGSIYVQSQTGDTIPNPFKMPHTFGIGLTYVYDNRLTIGVDYTLQKWNTADLAWSKFNKESVEMNSRTKIAFGAEFVPSYISHNYLKRIRYRMGAYYSSPYNKVSYTSPDTGTTSFQDGAREYGVSIGFGLPMFQSKSMLNISGQYIKVSPKFKGLMEENYLRINIGLTFNERWFMKWKVD